MSDTIYIYNQIETIDVQLSQYEKARTTLETMKTTFQGDITSLKDSYHKLSGNADLAAVKKADVFEGEMADRMAERISAYQEDVNGVITGADDIISGIDTQIATIDNKIAALNSKRATLETDFLNAQKAAQNQP